MRLQSDNDEVVYLGELRLVQERGKCNLLGHLSDADHIREQVLAYD
jgi:hypothetical protein